MDSDYPVNERIFILKGDDRLGPFEIDEILEKLDEGMLGLDDVCLREGAGETERLRQILDWEEPEPARIATDHSSPHPDDENDAEYEEEGAPPQRRSNKPLYHGHRSMVTFPLAFPGLVGGSIGAVWLYPADPAFTFAGITIAVLSLAYLSLMRYTREYFITEKRIELVTGLIARSSKEVRITDIRAVNISCKGFAGMIGVGTVDFFTIGDSPEVSFSHAWAAKEIKSLVRKLQDSSG